MLSIYCDGACGHAGDGGWGWALVRDDQLSTYDSGSESESTNQRCELLAAIKGFEYMTWQHPDESFELVSDSAYVINCFQQKWHATWVSRGWRTSSNMEIKNSDLWLDLLCLWEEYPSHVTFRHVRGHHGDQWNEYVDNLAVLARADLTKNPVV